MRLTSEFWVSALMRRVRDEGGFAYLVRRGAQEAGTIFIKIRDRQDQYLLYAPAPQTEYDQGSTGDRFFSLTMSVSDEAEINQRLESELRFDPDLWLVEIEDCDQACAMFNHDAVK